MDRLRILVILAPFLLTPSLGLFQKVATRWSVAYLFGGCLALTLWWRWRENIFRQLDRLPDRSVTFLIVAIFILLGIAYHIGYPLANANNATGGGSDTDESYNLGVRALWNLEYPYYPLTYLGNPISGMPGSIFLAMPFVLLGNSALQNLFWLAAFFVATSIHFRDRSIAVLQFASLLTLAPITLHSIVTGNDLFANSLFVLIAILVVIRVIPDHRAGVLKKLAAAAFIGVAMSSRSNFLLLLPLTLRVLAGRCGWKTTLTYSCVGAIVFSAITIPFWLYDPPNFGPLLKQNKFEYYHDVLPHADIAVPGTALVFAVVLAAYPGRLTEHSFWRRCGLIQMYPIAAITCLHMVAVRWPSFRWMIYGQAYLFFGSLAFWLELSNSESRVQVRRHRSLRTAQLTENV